ncbi:hypothetical protein MOV61_20000 [Neorhizobium sp. BETTINA12A]|uniref:hypothetical protein n=1 Tax=Neorhizobium sp. BETTINA12A TaxID=2908924 RepID=UPI001FF13211|nr:hypothetical protein [Neorhizobium sp. BETTINA12A]MCJ9753007.1 hypothetical protein [Neorhizobium sp. BETTINA12A]
MKARVKREAKIIASMLGGLFGTALAIFAHFFIWMGFPPLNSDVAFLATSLLIGLPTPGGAPYGIHLYNSGIWAFWGAVFFSLIMRICFGHLRVSRVFLIYVAGMALIAVGGKLAEHAIVEGSALGNGFLIAYVVVGLFGVRDWPAQSARPALQDASSEA